MVGISTSTASDEASDPVSDGTAASTRAAAAYSPNGVRIATASADKTARIWDATSGELITTLEGHGKSVGALAYSPDGARIATASSDRRARV